MGNAMNYTLPKKYEEWTIRYFGSAEAAPEACLAAWEAATLEEQNKCYAIVKGNYGWDSNGKYHDDLGEAIRENAQASS